MYQILVTVTEAAKLRAEVNDCKTFAGCIYFCGHSKDFLSRA
jgi:hypothetical protein